MRRNLKNLFVLGALLCGATMYAQENTVTGTVKDQEGFAVEDALVTTSSGNEAITNAEGKFVIVANKGDIITIEAYNLPKQTLTVGNATNYTVTLSPVNDIELDEAVVTALGIKRDKKSLGFASQEIKSDELSSGTTNTGNIASQLSGKVAGLNVTTTSNLISLTGLNVTV